MLWPLLLPLALAQDPDAPSPPPEDAGAARAEAEAEAALAALRAALAQSEADRAVLSTLLEAGGVIAAPGSSVQERVAAVEVLAESGDARALPFLERAAQQQPEVRVAVLAYAPAQSGSPRMHALVRALSAPSEPLGVRLAAVVALDAAAVPDAFAVLWEIAVAEDTPPEVREAARAQLTANHSAAVAERGGLPAVTSPLDPGAALGMTLSSAVVGSTLLASVGQLGQTDAGPVIGGTGGVLIGGGLGLLGSSAGEGVSPEDSLQYTSGTLWGFTAGALLSAGTDINGDEVIYLLAAGSTAGAGGALLNFRNEPSIADTMELNGAILLGQQIGAGARRWALPGDERAPLFGLLGGALGGAAGAAARGPLELDGDDGALMTAGGASGLWLSLLVPAAREVEVLGGRTQVGIPVGVIAGGALGQVADIPARTTGIATYGFFAGNLAGVGTPLLFTDPDTVEGSAVARWTLAGGVLGSAAGAVAAPRLEFDSGDAVLVPVASALTVAEAAALGFVASERGGFDRTGGLVLFSAGAGAAGWGLVSQRIDASPGASLLVASGAGWGVFYGGLTPLALGLEGDAADLVLAMTVTSDVLMGAAAVAQHPAVGLKPQATVLPQLGGVGGAVIGSLGAALFTSDSQHISAGSLVGSVAGIGLGIGLERRYGSDWIPRLAPPTLRLRHRLDLPGEWNLAAAPTLLEDGEVGLHLGIQASRF